MRKYSLDHSLENFFAQRKGKKYLAEKGQRDFETRYITLEKTDHR